METHESDVLGQLSDDAQRSAGWMKLIGIYYMVVGVPMVIVLVGIFLIWYGWVIYQAGVGAREGSTDGLIRMMDRMRIYWLVQGVLMLIGIAMMIVYVAVIVWLIASGFPVGEYLGIPA